MTGSKDMLWQYLERYHETEKGLSAKTAWLSARQSEGGFGTTQANFIIKFLI